MEALEGGPPASEMTSEVTLRGLPLRVIDTFREARNKVQLFSLIRPLIWGGGLLAIPMVSCDLVTSSCQSGRARLHTSGRLPTAVTVKRNQSLDDAAGPLSDCSGKVGYAARPQQAATKEGRTWMRRCRSSSRSSLQSRRVRVNR